MRSFPSLISNNSFATVQCGKLVLKILNHRAVRLPSFRLSLHSVGSLCLFSHLIVTFPVLLSTSLRSLFVTNYSLFIPNCPYFSLSIVFLSLCVSTNIQVLPLFSLTLCYCKTRNPPNPITSPYAYLSFPGVRLITGAGHPPEEYDNDYTETDLIDKVIQDQDSDVRHDSIPTANHEAPSVSPECIVTFSDCLAVLQSDDQGDLLRSMAGQAFVWDPVEVMRVGQ